MASPLKRIFSSGLKSFWRSGAVSLSSILVLTITLLVINGVVFLQAILDFSLRQIQNKVDVVVYFYPDADLGNVDEVMQAIQDLPEVDSVVLTSPDEAYDQFVERHKNDNLTLQSLDVLGENPFGASLSIRAVETSQYESVVAFFEEGGVDAVIDPDVTIEEISYRENKAIIERIASVISSVRTIGLALSLLLIGISLLVTFNTIRLAIYMTRSEIKTMRLVGADDLLIQGPYMVVGITAGLVAALVTLVLMYPLSLWVAKHTIDLLGGMDIFAYYLNNFGQLAGLTIASGVLVGAFASFIAIRKHLRV